MWSVFFIFLSYLDRNFVRGDFLSSDLDTEKEGKEMFTIINDTFCAKMSTVRENFLFQVSDGAEAVRSFVSPAGKLMNCSVIVNQVHVKSFMHECRMGVKELKAGLDMDVRFARMEDAKMMCREFKERSEWGRDGRNNEDKKDDSALQDKVLKRSKRGFTYPGTLWCGAGNMADHYDQLGEFAETDSCCRIHDHCPNVIHAFSSNYGYTNYKWHSICHCDCDNALKACLRKVNDTSSRIVGQAFFNVIGVPCFEFAFEEQCAERHWYGMCKRYQKFPVAVLREAVPYDFGGIDVIDVLTLPPLKRKESKKIQEEKPESTTQSTMSSPEEPSLGNVVTAAEDFIKVLATVSTSQSSTTESDKTETQSSEKKRKKNTGKKKKNRKHKGKGKGRKRKPKEETGVKAGEGASVSTSGSKAEDAMVLSNFISEAHKHESSRDKNRVIDEKFELGEREEPSNEVMKDEPALDKEPVSNSTPATDQKKPAESVTEGLTEALEQITSSPIRTAVTQLKTKSKRLRKGRRKKGKKIPSSEGFVTSTTVSSRTTSVPSTVTTTPLVLQQQSTRSDTEKRLVFSTAGTPIVIPKVKRNRSKEREGGDEKRRVNSASPIEATSNENSSTDNLMSFTGAAPELSLTTPGQPVSHRQGIYGGSVSVHTTAPNPSLRVLKRRKLKVKGLRSRRRKTVLQLYHNSTEHSFPFLPVLGMSNALNTPVTTAAVSQPKEAEETHNNWKLLTITTAPSVATKTHKHPHRQHIGSRNKASPRSVIDDISVSTQTGPTQMTFTTSPYKVTTTVEINLQTTESPPKTTLVTPIRPMSPLQLSIERAKEQFFLKKRRKALMALRQY